MSAELNPRMYCKGCQDMTPYTVRKTTVMGIERRAFVCTNCNAAIKYTKIRGNVAGQINF